MKTAPKVTWKYTGPEEGELALFWINPWDGKEEKIATFWWPGHPVEATADAERLFEAIAARACIGTGPGVSDAALAARLGPSVADQLEAGTPLRSDSGVAKDMADYLRKQPCSCAGGNSTVGANGLCEQCVLLARFDGRKDWYPVGGTPPKTAVEVHMHKTCRCPETDCACPLRPVPGCGCPTRSIPEDEL